MVAVATLRLTSPDHPPTYGPARQTPKDTPESGDAKNPPLSGPLSAKSAKMEAASISLYKAKADAEGRSPKSPAGSEAPSVPRKPAGNGGFSKTKLADTPILVWATPAAKAKYDGRLTKRQLRRVNRAIEKQRHAELEDAHAKAEAELERKQRDQERKATREARKLRKRQLALHRNEQSRKQAAQGARGAGSKRRGLADAKSRTSLARATLRRLLCHAKLSRTSLARYGKGHGSLILVLADTSGGDGGGNRRPGLRPRGGGGLSRSNSTSSRAGDAAAANGPRDDQNKRRKKTPKQPPKQPPGDSGAAKARHLAICETNTGAMWVFIKYGPASWGDVLTREVTQRPWLTGEWQNAPSGQKRLGLWRIVRSETEGIAFFREQANRCGHSVSFPANLHRATGLHSLAPDLPLSVLQDEGCAETLRQAGVNVARVVAAKLAVEQNGEAEEDAAAPAAPTVEPSATPEPAPEPAPAATATTAGSATAPAPQSDAAATIGNFFVSMLQNAAGGGSAVDAAGVLALLNGAMGSAERTPLRMAGAPEAAATAPPAPPPAAPAAAPSLEEPAPREDLRPLGGPFALGAMPVPPPPRPPPRPRPTPPPRARQTPPASPTTAPTSPAGPLVAPSPNWVPWRPQAAQPPSLAPLALPALRRARSIGPMVPSRRPGAAPGSIPTECFFFFQPGGCRRGANCPFQHPR